MFICIIPIILQGVEIDKSAREKTFADPFFELFLWSILSFKSQLLDFLWMRCSNPLLAAVVGGKEAAINQSINQYD